MPACIHIRSGRVALVGPCRAGVRWSCRQNERLALSWRLGAKRERCRTSNQLCRRAQRCDAPVPNLFLHRTTAEHFLQSAMRRQ